MTGALEGKVAMVTGAARGTGEATAKMFVAEGARVVLGDVLDDRGRSVAEGLGAAASYTHLDITSMSDWESALDHTIGTYGVPDVLVNNAAILIMKPIHETTFEEYENVVRVNLTGTFAGIKTVSTAMKDNGGGSIVNVSSVDGLRGGDLRTAYCSAKWGVRGLTRAAAFDLGRFNIRVNSVCPGGGGPEMSAPWIPPTFDLDMHLRTVALGRDGELSEYAAAITYLASDAASYITAADLVVDGGVTAGHSMATLDKR